MLSEDLQIYRDTYELARKLYEYSQHVPKHVRYGEYGRAVSMTFEALDLIYVANSDKDERPAALRRYLQLIGGVRSRIRLMGEMKYLSPRQAVNVNFLLERMSKQATGWRNSHGQSRNGISNPSEPHS